jgi:translocation protein SEC62
MVMEKESDKKTASIYLVLMVVAILALMCFRLWPLWLKKGIWYISFYLLVFLVVTAILRVILWGILYHFGLEVWLFPNYFIDSNDPRDSFLPVWSFETREDMFDVRSIVFRLLSGALLVYMCYQFCQDEKNIEDLKDLAENGLTDLFEYGQEFMVGGNALGDGSKKNETEEDKKKEETFQEKYRRELKKDFDDLIKEEDEDAPETEVDTDEADGAEGEGKPLNLEDLMNDEDEPEEEAKEAEPEGEKAAE